MIEMTLSSRHRIRNTRPGGLRPSTLPHGHGGSPQYWLWEVDGEETILFLTQFPRPGTEPRTLAWKAAVLTTTLGPRPFWRTKSHTTQNGQMTMWPPLASSLCQKMNSLRKMLSTALGRDKLYLCFWQKINLLFGFIFFLWCSYLWWYESKGDRSLLMARLVYLQGYDFSKYATIFRKVSGNFNRRSTTCISRTMENILSPNVCFLHVGKWCEKCEQLTQFPGIYL